MHTTMSRCAQVVSFVLVLLAALTSAKEYKLREKTYEYYSLPFCKPKRRDSEENLGEILAGDRKQTSLYSDVRFGVEVEYQQVCEPFKLSQDQIKQFRDAIRNDFMFEFFIDDLAVRGFIGEQRVTQKMFQHHMHNETGYFLYTHLHFSIAFNRQNVIAVNITSDPQQSLELVFDKDLEVDYSYSVKWQPTAVSFENRQFLHSKQTFFEGSMEVHWVSIVNSCVLVVLMAILLIVILIKVLRNDMARYLDINEEELGDERDESGWKQVHGDVFRAPSMAMLFSVCVGTGVQLLALVVGILSLSLVGLFYPGNKGFIVLCGLLLYMFTSGIAGFISVRLYLFLGGTKWATTAIFSACLFSVPFFLTFCVINTIALVYGSTAALPIETIIVVFFLWAIVTIPLTVICGARSKATYKEIEVPCKTNRCEREIPPSPFYRSVFVRMALAGFLPFSAIYVELHYLFSAVWGHHVYTFFGVLSVAFALLIAVTCIISVVLVYFQLAAEDYKWWWNSFLFGGSAGFFIFAYAAFYYVYRTQMSGVLQAAFFFGYVLMASYAFFLILGAIGFFSSFSFVRHIYKNIKSD